VYDSSQAWPKPLALNFYTQSQAKLSIFSRLLPRSCVRLRILHVVTGFKKPATTGGDLDSTWVAKSEEHAEVQEPRKSSAHF